MAVRAVQVGSSDEAGAHCEGEPQDSRRSSACRLTGVRARTAGLPVAVYPQRPPDSRELDYNRFNRRRAVKTWLFPYFQCLLHSRGLRPLLAYLFTDFKCNLQCHYCWASDNRRPGMTGETARESVDWLHGTGCRVLALMGGEPLLRPDFVHRLTAYAARKDFFVYLPTNGRLMTPDIIDRLGDAGLATINLAIDAVDPKPGLPKALSAIRPQFDYLVRRQTRYGIAVFLNINICHNNLDDVLALTEVGRQNGIATDYHINEEPLIEQCHFRYGENNPTYIRKEDWPRIDALLDRLIEKNRSGYKMVNTVKHFEDMKQFLRGVVEPWRCRAGRNSLIIRTDGTLAPCFTYYSSAIDWGRVGSPRFDLDELDLMKKECTLHCLSTCQHTLGYAFNALRVLKWLAKQVRNGCQGVTGGF